MAEGTLTKTGFRNRIVGLRWIKASELRAHPKNFRTHPKHQREALEGVLRELGIGDAQIVYWDEEHGWTLIDGELRKEIYGDQEVPCLETDYVSWEADYMLSTLDPLAAMAAIDTEKLDELLRDVQTGETAVQEMLAELAQNAGITPPDDFDPNAEWVGMPEFEHEDQTAHQSIVVHLKNEDAVSQFANALNKTITPQTKYIWIPDDGLEPIADTRYDDES